MYLIYLLGYDFIFVMVLAKVCSFRGGSSWCICFTFSVLLLSDALFFSAGWSCLDSHLNVALVASEFIVGILLSKAWYQSVAT